MDETNNYTDTVMPMPIYTIAYKCIVCFSRIDEIHNEEFLRRVIYPDDKATPLVRGKLSPFNFLGLRNNFLYWLENTGALKLMNSLDGKLTEMSSVSDTVVELLQVVLANLNRNKPEINTSSSSEEGDAYWENWQDAACAAESAMYQLNRMVDEIETFSARQTELSLATTLTEEDVNFRREIALSIRHRFPVARQALSEQLAASVAAKRRILLRGKYPMPVRRVTSTMAMGPFGTAQEGPFDYPPLPDIVTIKERRDPRRPETLQKLTGVRCPFCTEEILLRSSEDDILECWKHHINKHIEPYPCLYPQCAEALESFVHREDWVEHMESKHSKDWLQRVHTRAWYCDTGHVSPIVFELEDQWKKHMMQPHPEYRKAPNLLNLGAYSVRKQKHFLRDEYVCPLCERIPTEVQRMLETGQNEPGQVRSLVLNHVASELKSLSMMAVPSFDNIAYKTANFDPNPVAPKSATHVDFQDDTGRTALSFAAEAGDIEAVGKLFDRQADIELADTDGQTPLLWAARKGHGEVVKFLVDHGAQTEATDETYGRTSLSWAAANGHINVAEILCMKGADMNAADDMNRTPLSLAASARNEELLGLLLFSIRTILDASPDLVSSDHETMRTPLHWAAFENRPGNVELLLGHGAHIDLCDGSFKTSLYLASEKGHPDVVKVLLREGANMEACHPVYNQTPLSVASECGHGEVVQLLLTHGAKVETKDFEGFTARDWAVKQGHTEIAKLLETNQR
ncbi:ankyrin repeat protein [Fusarium circinatum]|uniref:Ankyrin repeat protein n=1 Tax=Fusarium circinatum TaxID=48490 RepID=A0A8H6CTZ0_FUSCI|nr:ankyrin repeat protein [Fusarium circinatum]